MAASPRGWPALKLSHRLIIAFGGVLLILVGLAALALYRLEGVATSLRLVTEVGAKRSHLIHQMDRSAQEFGSTLRAFPVASPLQGASNLGKLVALESAHQKSADGLRELLAADAEALQLLEKVARAAAETFTVVTEARKETGAEGDPAVAMAVRLAVSADLAKWDGRLGAWSGAMQQLNEWDDKIARRIADETARDAVSSRGVLIGGAILGLLLAATMAAWLIRHVNSGLQRAAAAARQLAELDLSTPVGVDRQDEVGELLNALEVTRITQLQLAQGVSEAVNQIRHSCDEIAQGTHQLSSRTEASSQHVIQLSQTIDTLSQAIAQTSAAASEAAGRVAIADSVAREGSETAQQAMASMSDAAESSGKIVEVVSLIDGIAFQTNILALNAAVEAARAGDQGRGFAVVASEVRALAQRSASAAREVKSLIEGARTHVAEGVQQVQLSGNKANEVMTEVRSFADALQSISAGARGQSDTIDGSRNQIAQLEGAVHHNAAMAEESAAATRSLADQADYLGALVASYKLVPA